MLHTSAEFLEFFNIANLSDIKTLGFIQSLMTERLRIRELLHTILLMSEP